MISPSVVLNCIEFNPVFWSKIIQKENLPCEFRQVQIRNYVHHCTWGYLHVAMGEREHLDAEKVTLQFRVGGILWSSPKSFEMEERFSKA